ncbi:helicase-related protein [Mucilaginibacter litoreus]|uniref:Helicase-related protein n=1 Tax=Mucilaginibacter litoreus TaxID=1048221 RepID=A0ABW3AVQ6_9SPHI
MPKIYDNIENQLSQGLNQTLDAAKRADLCVGYFNLRGWREIGDKIDVLNGDNAIENKVNVFRTCRLLVGMQKMPIDILKEQFSKEDHQIDQAEALKLRRRLAEEFKDQLTIGAPTETDEKALRLLSQQMKDKKVVVKLHLRYPLHAKLYLCYLKDRDKIEGFVGSSNLTLAGLSRQGELNVDVEEQDAAKKLVTWFEDRWIDKWCFDITDELIEIIDNSWAADRLFKPYHIYLKIAYHLAQEARAGISEFKVSSVFQKDLLPFQVNAVQRAAKMLNKRGGVMIGDVVGLGKTITATALAKIFEDDFFLETLIICPKNLVDMWEHYVHRYQLRAKIISQSLVQRLLPTLRRYRLVIIDESHNLRNDQGSRYRAIRSYLEENESKVILLSATPYNKTYLDLSNQLRLFINDDRDLGISPENYINSIGGRVEFEIQHSSFIRSIKAFEHSTYSDDWRELMRLFLVRRTRSFVRKWYTEQDSENDRRYLTFADGSRSYFPDRIPKRVEYEFNPSDPLDQYAHLYSADVVNCINNLSIPRYGLGNYLTDRPLVRPTSDEQSIIANLSRAGKRLVGFCRTNLFKRLESSGYSFLLSLSRHALRNFIFIYAIENQLPIPVGKNTSHNLDDYLDDQDLDDSESERNHLNLITDETVYLKQAEKVYASFRSPKHLKKFDWIRSEFFNELLMQELIDDCRDILSILLIAKTWEPSQDRQLNALFNLITKNHANDKVLVFTQFADTAEYLHRQLVAKGVNSIDFVTGDNENPTLIAHRFSPQSNRKPEIVTNGQEIRVLITTDVLSEGQNLQDGHIIVNYDLPWAIIRLIQRAGRVDRIGQKSSQIICYSFLPEDGIEQIINLRGRLSNRIKENAEVVGSDETFFDGDPINIEDLYNERSNVLEEKDDDSEIDLSSYAYQIWKNATDADPELNKLIPDLPNVVYATKAQNNNLFEDGVIVYSRTADDNDVLAWLNEKGEVITNSQLTILKAAQCNAYTTPLPKIAIHHELVAKAMDIIKEEEKTISGTLGKKTGVKYRVYMRLDRYIKEFENTLFVTEALKKALDDIYKYPLKEFARETFNRQLKSGIADDQLANLSVSLREEDKLCHIDDGDFLAKEAQIICSMGLIHNLN